MMLTRPSHTCTDTRLQIWNLSDATRLSMSPPDWTWGLLTDRRMSAGAKLELQIVAWSWMSEYVYFHPSYPPVVSRAQVMKPAHTAGITRDKNLALKFSGYIILSFLAVPPLLIWAPCTQSLTLRPPKFSSFKLWTAAGEEPRRRVESVNVSSGIISTWAHSYSTNSLEVGFASCHYLYSPTSIATDQK